MRAGFAGRAADVPRWDLFGLVRSASTAQEPSCSCLASPWSCLQLFHGSTYIGEDGTVKSGGGRVMCVTATGSSLQEAQQKAYQAGVFGNCLCTRYLQCTACPLHNNIAIKSCRL